MVKNHLVMCPKFMEQHLGLERGGGPMAMTSDAGVELDMYQGQRIGFCSGIKMTS
jgi:hypothetical protein